MIDLPVMSPIVIRMANHYLKKVGATLGPEVVLETCDRSGITQAGYAEVYKKFKGSLQTAGKGLHVGCLLNPHQVGQLRQELNSKLKDFVGEWKVLENTYEAPSTAVGKRKSKQKLDKNSLTLTKYNNLFLDIDSVQRTMVRLYDITPSGISDPTDFARFQCDL
jgi:hypothetical protein